MKSDKKIYKLNIAGNHNYYCFANDILDSYEKVLEKINKSRGSDQKIDTINYLSHKQETEYKRIYDYSQADKINHVYRIFFDDRDHNFDSTKPHIVCPDINKLIAQLDIAKNVTNIQLEINNITI